MPKGKGYAKSSSNKGANLKGTARALSNPGASKRSGRATEMLRKHTPAIKKMAERHKKKMGK